MAKATAKPTGQRDEYFPVHTTKRGVVILVTKGTKGKGDFIVKYREPKEKARIRTPKHIHLVVDLYMKLQGNPTLTMKLVDHILQLINRLQPNTVWPPRLRVFKPRHAARFQALEGLGEYSVEFLLVTTELIMIQEKTNYPNGQMNLNLFQKIKNQKDIFSVVQAATFRG